MQDKVEYSDKGILIPAEWLQDIGKDISVKKSGKVIIIETKQRESARKKLVRMVGKLRVAADELGQVSNDELDTIVNEVREKRTSNH